MGRQKGPSKLNTPAFDNPNQVEQFHVNVRPSRQQLIAARKAQQLPSPSSPSSTPPSPSSPTSQLEESSLTMEQHSPPAPTGDSIADLKAWFDHRLDRMERLMTAVKEDNQRFKTMLQEKDKEIHQLKTKLNAQEQYQRSWSIRILNLKVPAEVQNQPEEVMKHVHEHVLLPLFKGAIEKGLIYDVPSPHQVLETAHILPAKAGTIPPIIARFYTRNIRAMMFRMKKEFALRAPSPSTVPTTRNRPATDKILYPFFEDLTRTNFNVMRDLANHAAVESAWSVGGVIRYRLKGDSNTKKVKDVLAHVDDIIRRRA